jgi:nitrate/nitrite transport system substrate-binding protein
MLGLATGGVWAAGSDKPEKEEVKIGFIPLTDCASVVMASVLGFDKKYGVKFVLSKEASWAGVRDKLANGDLDAWPTCCTACSTASRWASAARRRTWPC